MTPTSEDLTAVARGGDACGAMDGKTEVALFGRNRLTGVDAHPHADLGSLRPVVLGERALGLDRGKHGPAHACEGDEERVALRVNHATTVPRENGAEEAPMLRKHLSVAIA
jgi:hypothetical protein